MKTLPPPSTATSLGQVSPAVDGTSVVSPVACL